MCLTVLLSQLADSCGGVTRARPLPAPCLALTGDGSVSSGDSHQRPGRHTCARDWGERERGKGDHSVLQLIEIAMLTAHSFEQKGSLQRVKEQQMEEGAVLSGGGRGGYNVAQVCCRQVKALGWRSTASMAMPTPVCHLLLRGDLAVPV